MRTVRRLVMVLGLVALAIAGAGLVWLLPRASEPEVFSRVQVGMTAEEVTALFGRDPSVTVRSHHDDGLQSPEVEHRWFMDLERESWGATGAYCSTQTAW